MQPDVSVLMPVYNGLTNYPAGTLEKAIRTTREQEGVAVEFCIVNDASMDGSQAWLRECEYFKSPTQIAYIGKSTTNRGIADSLDRASCYASGRYIIVQSVRSWYEPGALKAMVDALDGNPEVGFVYGKTQYHGAQEHIYTPPPFIRSRFFTHFDSLFGYMYRREALDAGCRYEGYIEREGKHIDISDYDFVMQLIVKMGWSGLALRDRLCLHYLYSGEGQMTNLVHKYQGEIDAIFRQRWGEAV